MRTIYDTIKSITRIAKVELYTMFYSPVAWLLLIVFAFQVGSHISESMDYTLHSLDLGRPTSNLSDVIISSWNGIYNKIVNYLYLYIPLLTMGVMSREYSSGSIKLLYSSPVSNFSIIMGKFCAMVVYGFAIMLIILANLIYINGAVENFEIVWALCGLLGVLLLFITYVSIGLFVSSLTQYQVVAAVGTLALLSLFTMVGDWFGKIPILSEITYWLGMGGRVGVFTQGLITSEDVVYFITIVGLFLTLSILRLNLKRNRKSTRDIIIKYSTLVVVVIVVCLISINPSTKLYYDGTSCKTNTLSLESQEIMNMLDGDLKVTEYINILGLAGYNGSPTSMLRAKNKYKQYIRFNPDMEIKTIAYWDSTFNNHNFTSKHLGKSLEEMAKIMCKNQGYNFDDYLTPEEIKEIRDVRKDDNVYLRVFELTTKDNKKESLVRSTLDGTARESHLSTAIRRLVETSPKIAFISSHPDRSVYNKGDRGFFNVAINKHTIKSFVNNGFDVVELNLDNQDITDEVNIIILSDLIKPLSNTALSKIKRYIDNGGNIFILGEANRSKNMNEIAAHINISFEEGMIVSPSRYGPANEISARATREGVQKFSALREGYYRGYRFSAPTASPIDYSRAVDKFKITEIFRTEDRGYWVDKDSESVNFLDDQPILDPKLGEQERAFALVVALERNINGKEQRILISGDADCIANAEDVRNTYYRKINDEFRTSALRWMTNDKFPVYASYPGRKDNKYKLPKGIRSVNKIATGYAIGTLLIIGAIVIIVRRKRK